MNLLRRFWNWLTGKQKPKPSGVFRYYGDDYLAESGDW